MTTVSTPAPSGHPETNADLATRLERLRLRVVDYEEAIKLVLATLRMMRSAGAFDMLPADRNAALSNTAGVRMLDHLDDELDRVDQEEKGEPSFTLSSLVIDAKAGRLIEGGARG